MSGGLRYRVIGSRGLSNSKTGEIINDDDLIGINVQALIEGGHIIVEEPEITIELLKEEE